MATKKYKDILTNEVLIDLYINKKMSSREIAKMFNLNKSTVLEYLRSYNITLEQQLEGYVLNDLQRDLIIGSLLGDGHIGKTDNHVNYYFTIGHGVKQKEYLKSKLSIVENLCNENPLKHRKYEDNEYYSFNTKALSLFNEYKSLTIEEMISNLNENSLTIWFLDDGSNDKNTFSISAKRFNKKELYYAKGILEGKFGIKSSEHFLNKNDDIHKGLLFNRENSEKLATLIRQSDFGNLAEQAMGYKLNY